MKLATWRLYLSSYKHYRCQGMRKESAVTVGFCNISNNQCLSYCLCFSDLLQCLVLSRERCFTMQFSQPTTGRGLTLAQYPLPCHFPHCVSSYPPKVFLLVSLLLPSPWSVSNLHVCCQVSSLVCMLKVRQHTKMKKVQLLGF